jgi:hypothetical protein
VEAALEREPLAVLTLIQRDFPFLPEKEREFLAGVLLNVAIEPEGKWFTTLLDRFEAGREINARIRNSAWTRFQDEAGGERARLTALANLLLRARGDLEFTHRLFRGTFLEPQLRSFRIRDITEEGKGGRGGIHDVYVLRKFGEFLEEFPEDPEGTAHFVEFLATVPRKKVRDPARALTRAKDAVEKARGVGDEGPLARLLVAYATAAFADGKGTEAVRAMEEALSLIPEGASTRAAWERRLERYREGEGGGD